MDKSIDYPSFQNILKAGRLLDVPLDVIGALNLKRNNTLTSIGAAQDN